MYKVRKKIIAFSLLTIFGLALGLLCSYGYDLYAQKTDLRQNNTEAFHSVLTGSLPGAAVQPDKQVSVAYSHTQAFKYSFAELLAIQRSIEHSFSDLFEHYSSVSANLPSQRSRSAIIFPFHYFL